MVRVPFFRIACYFFFRGSFPYLERLRAGAVVIIFPAPSLFPEQDSRVLDEGPEDEEDACQHPGLNGR